MAIYLTQESNHPYLWLIPVSAELEEKSGVTFVKCERTTLAIWPINLTSPRLDRGLTESVQFKVKKHKDGRIEKQERWVNSQALKAMRKGQGVYGFAVEIDEGNSTAFVQQASRIEPETDEVSVRGAAAMTAVSGRRVRLQWGNTMDAIKIWRDGKLRDWSSEEENVAYRPLKGELVHQAWQGDGRLTVSAGGKVFSCRLSREGDVEFTER
jgi:hypothetical protein